jgi:hypothetical protein
MSGIFISYRREDSAGFAGRLADALEQGLGTEQVFRDVDDIRPGQDFVDAIETQLRQMDVVLVLIGPQWSDIARDGARRLDDPDDFVRLEIRLALAQGKPLIPVLVGGALMPAERDLPEDIRALARRQAFSLSDAGWKGDVARLGEAIQPMLGERRRSGSGRLAWGLAGAAGLLAGLILLSWQAQTPPLPVQPGLPPLLDGRWTAMVRYDWGDAHAEVFEFEVTAGEVHGTATYLRTRRAIQDGRLSGNRLSFTTQSQEMLGGQDEIRTVTHRYRGTLDGDVIRFTLASGGGQSRHEPVRFEARRATQ